MMNETSLKNASEEDIIKVMEILLITEDIDLQVKLFNILAIHVMSNSTHKEKIITNDLLYEKIYNVLSKGLPVKSARTMDFISVLLYSDDDAAATRARSVTLRAQNMLRTSGCLAAMANLFTTNMLHQETWRALCRCLAETCRDSVENQSYCSHLVLLCVNKCIQGNVDAYSVLKSLINNHSYNMNLFFESKGMEIFKRKDSLQNDRAMQLLSIVIQHTPKEMLIDLRNAVTQNLEYFKQLYGAETKTGQWATINLYDLNTRIKDTIIKGSSIAYSKKKKVLNNSVSVQNHSVVDIGVLKPNDTARLIRNVLREIQQFNAQEQSRKTTLFNKNCINSNVVQVQSNKYNKKFPTFEKFQKDDNNIFYDKIQFSNEKNLTEANEMSFSFLLKQQSRDSISKNRIDITHNLQVDKVPNAKQTSTCRPTVPRTFKINSRRSLSNEANTSHSIFFDSMAADDSSLLDFKPLLVSTPKQVKRNKTMANLTQSIRNRSSQKFHSIKRKHLNYSNLIDHSKKPIKQRSISNRLFDAINDSCTTFVKTFQNIFKTKKSHEDEREQEENTSTTMNNLQSSCSYSFTNYMRKREAVLSKERTINANSDDTKLCQSCNDTGSLKRKIIDDSCLKETVSKLKLGINIYGCDFRKISKAMWPREAYMTPEVLYNLYRKLIVK